MTPLIGSYQSFLPSDSNQVKITLGLALSKISKRSPDSSFSEQGERYESNDTIVYQRLTDEVYEQLLQAAQSVNQGDRDRFIRQRRLENCIDSLVWCCGLSPKARFKTTLRCAQNYEKFL